MSTRGGFILEIKKLGKQQQKKNKANQKSTSKDNKHITRVVWRGRVGLVLDKGLIWCRVKCRTFGRFFLVPSQMSHFWSLFFPAPGQKSHFWSHFFTFFRFFFFFFSLYVFLLCCEKKRMSEKNNEKKRPKVRLFTRRRNKNWKKSDQKCTRKWTLPQKCARKCARSGPSLKSAPERGPFQKVRQKARLSCSIFACNFLAFFAFMICFCFLVAFWGCFLFALFSLCDCFCFSLHFVIACFLLCFPFFQDGKLLE